MSRRASKTVLAASSEIGIAACTSEGRVTFLIVLILRSSVLYFMLGRYSLTACLPGLGESVALPTRELGSNAWGRGHVHRDSAEDAPRGRRPTDCGVYKLFQACCGGEREPTNAKDGGCV